MKQENQKKPKKSKSLEVTNPYLVDRNLDIAYRQMAQDEARDADALEWSEGTAAGDVC